jgi:prolyl-tRNA editing enzyme YbaK/EbsC (Cys-tRNA(Pro) deacylase)
MVFSMDSTMNSNLSDSAQRVQDALQNLGLTLHVVELPASTRTAEQAAEAIGCTVGQIAKSLLFKTIETERPILVIASGTNRVDESVIGELVGEPIEMADPDFVRETTGFAIGGVPPVGHTQAIKTFIDEDLLTYETIWAAAGTPHAVFRLSPDDLLQAADGEVVSVK